MGWPLNLPFSPSATHWQTHTAVETPLVLPNLPVESSFWCSLRYLICDHETDVSMVHVLLHPVPTAASVSGQLFRDWLDVCMFSRDLRIAHWRWIVWCMHVLCIDSDAQSCFESVVTSTLNHSSWIRCYIRVSYVSVIIIHYDWL